jgi:hypothetical protein
MTKHMTEHMTKNMTSQHDKTLPAVLLTCSRSDHQDKKRYVRNQSDICNRREAKDISRCKQQNDLAVSLLGLKIVVDLEAALMLAPHRPYSSSSTMHDNDPEVRLSLTCIILKIWFQPLLNLRSSFWKERNVSILQDVSMRPRPRTSTHQDGTKVLLPPVRRTSR